MLTQTHTKLQPKMKLEELNWNLKMIALYMNGFQACNA